MMSLSLLLIWQYFRATNALCVPWFCDLHMAVQNGDVIVLLFTATYYYFSSKRVGAMILIFCFKSGTSTSTAGASAGSALEYWFNIKHHRYAVCSKPLIPRSAVLKLSLKVLSKLWPVPLLLSTWYMAPLSYRQQPDVLEWKAFKFWRCVYLPSKRCCCGKYRGALLRTFSASDRRVSTWCRITSNSGSLGLSMPFHLVLVPCVSISTERKTSLMWCFHAQRFIVPTMDGRFTWVTLVNISGSRDSYAVHFVYKIQIMHECVCVREMKGKVTQSVHM